MVFWRRPQPRLVPLTGNGYELTVLGIMSALVIALLVLVAVSTIRFFRGQRLRGLKSMIVIGVPIFFGASFSTIALWAPDVALLFWTIVAELILVIMLGIIGRKFAQ